MSKYAEIIQRLEKATGPNYQLECDILAATGGEFLRVPNVTASLSEAVALVERMLPGWYWRCGRTSLFPNGWAFLSKYAPDHCDRCDEFAAADGKAATPANAILLALFRALEAKEGA